MGPDPKAALAYWRARRINEAADLNDGYRVRVLVNGPAAHGYDASKLWFNTIWTKVMRDKTGFGGAADVTESGGPIAIDDDQLLVGNILADLGFLDGSAVESGDPQSYSNAIEAFQTDRGLPATGVLDEDTFYAITDPAEWQSLDMIALAAPPLIDPDGGAMAPLQGDDTAVENVPVFEPNSTVVPPTAEAIAPDEASLLAAAVETYAEYEQAEGEYVAQKFVPHTPIGKDDRIPVQSTDSFPASAVVRILFKSKPGSPFASNLCTGAMVSPDLVLTAGHCVHSGTARGKWYSDFTVYPGRNRLLKPFGSCRGIGVFALKGWVEAASNGEARYYDLGAIKLDCTVGDLTGWFGMRAMAEDVLGTTVTVQAYAREKLPPGGQWSSTGTIDKLEQLKAFYLNDTEGGSSGAPVFAAEDPTITCVHTNGLHGSPPWSIYNACTRLTAARLQTIADWMAE